MRFIDPRWSPAICQAQDGSALRTVLYGDDTHPRGALAAAARRTFPAIPVLPCDVSLRHPMGFCGLTRERWARPVGGVVCLFCQEIECTTWYV